MISKIFDNVGKLLLLYICRQIGLQPCTGHSLQIWSMTWVMNKN